jgi:hypothetical protein
MMNVYGGFGAMIFSKGNRNNGRKFAQIPLYLPQISHDLTWNETGPPAGN